MQVHLTESQKQLYLALTKHDWNKAFALCSSQEEIDSVKNLLAVRYGAKLEQLNTSLVASGYTWMIKAAGLGVITETARVKFTNELFGRLKELQNQLYEAKSTDEALDLAIDSLNLWHEVAKLNF